MATLYLAAPWLPRLFAPAAPRDPAGDLSRLAGAGVLRPGGPGGEAYERYRRQVRALVPFVW